MSIDTATKKPTAGDPIGQAIHLHQPFDRDLAKRFAVTDPSPGLELTRFPRIARLIRSRKFQFFLILPNQIIFWLVIGLGLVGTVVPGLNFGTAITWYLWFCLVFVMMAVVGRAWCVMCPFGGFAEWIQRATFWKRTQKRLGLGRKMPERLARYGFLLSVGAFILLTWIEEFFNIAGPGQPWDTSFMVLGIVVSALIFFLVFERRTFCRYICPLSALIGSVGSMGSVAGFRTKNRDVCLECTTKDCMRGGKNGYGCPWYTWPGSADSNAVCGLCSECYKGCPSNNVGLFLQKPLTSVVAPTRRRADIAWAVAILWGLVLFQQINALPIYATIDNWLNSVMHFPQYPNPVDYLGMIGGIAILTAGIAWVLMKLLVRKDAVIPKGGTSFVDRTSKFRAFFVPMMYGIIPVVGADYFARQLPKFFQHVTRLVPAVGAIAATASPVSSVQKVRQYAAATKSPLYTMHVLSNPSIIGVQVAIMAVATLAAMWTSWKIARRELAVISNHPRWAQVAAPALALVCGVVAGCLYLVMNAAD